MSRFGNILICYQFSKATGHMKDPGEEGKITSILAPPASPSPGLVSQALAVGHRPLESFTPTAASHLQMPQTWGLQEVLFPYSSLGQPTL